VTPAEGTCTSCHTPLPADAVFCPRCGRATPTQISAGGTTTGAASAEQTAEQQRRIQAALGPDYEVRRRIGSGGFAEVWAAFDRRLQRMVAVKVLHPDLVASRALLERFQREAQAVAKLRHPGVIPIYAVGEYEGLAYYIMPLVEGESLRERLTREGPLPPEEVGRILREAAAALAGAHRAGIVHRDIKPENLMLEGEERRVLVMDFGIAKSTAGTQTGLTGTGMIIGTPTYMSPEQATGSKEVDVRSDMYSLGVVGYELLTGRPPFTAPSVPELIMQHVTTPAPSVAAGRADVHESLAIAVNRCLMKEPGERWKDAAELSAFLERVATPASQPVAVSADLRRYAQPASVWNLSLSVLGQRARRHADRAARWARGAPRWKLLGTLALVLVGYVALFRQDSVRGTRDVVASWLHRGSVVAATPRVGSLLSGTFVVPGRVVSLADTALGIMTQADGLAFIDVFNGDRWSRVAGAPDRVNFTPLVSRGDLWLLPGRPGPTYRLAGARFVREDSNPIGVYSAWTDGDVIIAGGSGGGLAIRSAGEWRRLPTGRQRIGQLIGRARDTLYAIGGFGDEAEGRPDSLLVFDGFAWRSLDPRTDQRQVWFYNNGIARSDGGYVIVGRVISPNEDEAKRRYLGALVMERGRSATAWVRRNIHWGLYDPGDLHGVREAAGGVFVWGYSSMFELVGDSARFIAALGSRRVLDVATIRGRPYVVTHDGLVWTREKGEWAVVASVPGSGEIAAAVSGWQERSAAASPQELIPTFAVIGASGLLSVRRIVEAEPDVYWLLGQGNQIARVACTSRACEGRAVASPAPLRDTVLDLAFVLNWGVVAVGTNDLVATWTGSQWRREPDSRSGPPQAFVRLTSDTAGRVLLLGRRSVLRLRRGGQREVLGNLPPETGLPVDIAMGPSSSVAVLGAAGLAIRSPTTGFEYEQAFQDILGDKTPTAVDFLSDGRVLVATGNADPLLSGQLLIRGVRGQWTALSPLFHANLLGFRKDFQGNLWVTGTGWSSTRFWPGPDSTGVAPRSPSGH